MLDDVLLKPYCFLNEIDMATVTDCCGRGPFSAQQTLTSTVNTMTGFSRHFPHWNYYETFPHQPALSAFGL